MFQLKDLNRWLRVVVRVWTGLVLLLALVLIFLLSAHQRALRRDVERLKKQRESLQTQP